MNHRFALEGYGYRLRPIRMTDAQFIIETRLEDAERNRFIHTISRDVHQQEEWLRVYFEREGDYYFVIENRISKQPEGLIAFYDVADGKAEWGRWVLKKGSMAAVESAYLLYRIAFEQVGLDELYCRTIADNKPVVSLHTSMGELTRAILKEHFEIDGKTYDAVEQYSDARHFYDDIAPALEKHASMIYQRNLKRAFGGLSFHHIGVAVRSIEKELPCYTLLGYSQEGQVFEDGLQGIRGLFVTAKDQPRLELLENLDDSHTLDKQISQGQKMYHLAYLVGDIEKVMDFLCKNRAKVISPIKQSTYFKKRICFLILPNMQMIELIEL